MIEPFIMIAVLFYFFTIGIFCKPPEKSKPTEEGVHPSYAMSISA
jgi:hypothetical protein